MRGAGGGGAIFSRIRKRQAIEGRVMEARMEVAICVSVFVAALGSRIPTEAATTFCVAPSETVVIHRNAEFQWNDCSSSIALKTRRGTSI